jgi:hypothetical protein
MPRWPQRFRQRGISTFPAASFMVGSIARGAAFGRVVNRQRWDRDLPILVGRDRRGTPPAEAPGAQ